MKREQLPKFPGLSLRAPGTGMCWQSHRLYIIEQRVPAGGMCCGILRSICCKRPHKHKGMKEGQTKSRDAAEFGGVFLSVASFRREVPARSSRYLYIAQSEGTYLAGCLWGGRGINREQVTARHVGAYDACPPLHLMLWCLYNLPVSSWTERSLGRCIGTCTLL